MYSKRDGGGLTKSVEVSVYISVYLSICLSVYLSICLSVYLSVCLSMITREPPVFVYSRSFSVYSWFLILMLCDYMFQKNHIGLIFLLSSAQSGGDSSNVQIRLPKTGGSLYKITNTNIAHFIKLCRDPVHL